MTVLYMDAPKRVKSAIQNTKQYMYSLNLRYTVKKWAVYETNDGFIAVNPKSDLKLLEGFEVLGPPLYVLV